MGENATVYRHNCPTKKHNTDRKTKILKAN